MAKSPIAILYDAINGGFIKTIADGTDYLLGTASKIRNIAGSIINPATEETIVAIKDSAGIKKIVDALPTGDNLIGRVKLFDFWGNYITFKDNETVNADAAGIVLAGKDTGSVVRFLRTDRYGNFSFIPSENTQAAFGETRTAETYQTADYSHRYNLDSNEYGWQLSGSATVAHFPSEAAIKLQATGTSGDSAELRTHTYTTHQAGRGSLVRQFIRLSDTGQTNQIREWGLADENDGLLWRLDGSTFYIVRRSSVTGSVVETTYAQSTWNTDKMDGTGQSEETLDLTKLNHFEIQMQWPTGNVNFFVDSILVHKLLLANTINAPIFKTPNLPFMYKIYNTDASATGYIIYVTASGMVEGGEAKPEYTFPAATPTFKVVGTAEVPLLTIRPKLTFNSIANRMLIRPIETSVSTSEKRASFRLIQNATLTDASFTPIDNNSGVEYDVAASAFSGGLTIMKGILPNAIDSKTLKLDNIYDAVGRSLRRSAFGSDVDTLTITGKNEGSSSTTEMSATFLWQEIR